MVLLLYHVNTIDVNILLCMIYDHVPRLVSQKKAMIDAAFCIRKKALIISTYFCHSHSSLSSSVQTSTDIQTLLKEDKS